CLNAYKLGKFEESYLAFKKLVEHCPEDLVNRLTHQMNEYRCLIMQDSFYDVQILAVNLNKIGKRYLLENILKDFSKS
ncbi:hypothetical protein, partial [Escherichia coli]